MEDMKVVKTPDVTGACDMSIWFIFIENMSLVVTFTSLTWYMVLLYGGSFRFNIWTGLVVWVWYKTFAILFCSRVFACLVVPMTIHSPLSTITTCSIWTKKDIYPPVLVPLQVACRSNVAFSDIKYTYGLFVG